MFDKFKQLAQLKALQDEVKRQRFSGESSGVTVTISGSFTAEDVVLNPELSLEDQAAAVKKAFNSAVATAQAGMAEKLRGMM